MVHAMDFFFQTVSHYQIGISIEVGIYVLFITNVNFIFNDYIGVPSTFLERFDAISATSSDII